MNLTCPNCGTGFPITAGLNDAEARRFAVMMGELPPPVARLMPAYLALHKPLKQGLRWTKMTGLLGELLPDIKAAQVTHGGVTRAAPQALWVEALEKVVDAPNLSLPLTGNGLLRKILADLAGRATGAQEQRREQQAQARPHADREAGPQPVAKVVDREAGRAGANELRKAIRK